MSAFHDHDRTALIATGVWSVCSVAVAATWLIGLPHPFPVDPTAITVFSWLIIALSVLSAGAAFSGFGLRSRIRPRPLALIGLVLGLVAAGLQVVALPLELIDLMMTGRLPYPIGLRWQLIPVAALFGFAQLVRLEWRRARGRCLHCGGRHRSPARPVLDRPAPSMAPAAVTVAAAICLAAVFPWAAVELSATLSGRGLDVPVLAAGAGMLLAVLLLARLPGWLPARLLAGSSALAAVLILGYGYPLLITGLFDPTSMIMLDGLAFAGLGTALAIGAVSLLRRGRPVCRPGSYQPAPRVAVIGAGFAGLAAVKQLSKAGLDVILIDQRTYATFQPLLYQVATGGLNAGDITYPIRNFLARRRGVRFRCDQVTEIDHDHSVINTASGEPIRYDYLIIANGASANYFGIPGAAEHALPIYTRPDALKVRDRMFGLLEDAARTGPEAECTVVIVGGGATGIELAGNLAELRDHGLPRSYPELATGQIKIILVEASGRLLAPFAPTLQRYSLSQLRRRGVDVRLESPIVEIESDAVRFADGRVLPASLVIWTAGVRGSTESAEWRLERNRAGRILVDPTLQVHGKPEVFAVGDAAVIGANPLPQLAQPAMQTGKHAARQIVRLERDQPTQPFRYFDKGIMATIGEGSAVVEMPFGLKITGLLAWLTWLGIHIVYLLGGRNRLVTAANLAVRYLRPGSFGVIVGDPVRATPATTARQPQSATR